MYISGKFIISKFTIEVANPQPVGCIWFVLNIFTAREIYNSFFFRTTYFFTKCESKHNNNNSFFQFFTSKNSAREVMIHFESGLQDHLGWPPLVYHTKSVTNNKYLIQYFKSKTYFAKPYLVTSVLILWHVKCLYM